jgi:hypothetical protein
VERTNTGTVSGTLEPFKQRVDSESGEGLTSLLPVIGPLHVTLPNERDWWMESPLGEGNDIFLG